jgi:hypothetical protein
MVCFLAQDNGKISGFTYISAYREHDMEGGWNEEVASLYIRPGLIGTAAGGKLFSEGLHRDEAMGYCKIAPHSRVLRVRAAAAAPLRATV